MNSQKQERLGYFYGFLGVLAFSFTIPMTKVAVASFTTMTVGLGRALIAAVLAGVLLLIRRQKLASWSQARRLAVVAIGVVGGFPLLTSWAMNYVPAAHGAITIALLPLATAGAAVFRANERPSRAFWVASGAGCLVILANTVSSGISNLQLADLALLGAVLLAAIGYAEGGKLAQEIGSWQVISWALVFSAPFLLIPVAMNISWTELVSASPQAWLAFGYVSVISQFVGFLAWYGGMALAGVAKVSQIQYLQPFLSIIWAYLMLSEHVTLLTIFAAVVIVLIVAQGKKASVARKQVDVAK